MPLNKGKTLQPRQLGFGFDVEPEELFLQHFLALSFYLDILLLLCMFCFSFASLVKNEVYFCERPLKYSEGEL